MKTTKEMIEVMQAFVDGKTIQSRRYNFEEWEDIIYCIPTWNWDVFEYRIKPEQKVPKYRQYKNVIEFIDDYKERFNHQTIWLRGGVGCNNGLRLLVIGFDSDKNDVAIGGLGWFGMEPLFKEFVYLDGTPCGKLVKE